MGDREKDKTWEKKESSSDGFVCRSSRRRRRQGREDLQDEVRAVPRRRTGGRTQTGTKLRRPFRSRFRHHGRFLLLRGEQKQRRQVGRDDVVRLLVEPEEVHSRDEDGFRRLEETAR